MLNETFSVIFKHRATTLTVLYKIDEFTFCLFSFIGFQVVDTCGNVTLTASRILALAFAVLEKPTAGSAIINNNNTSSKVKSSIAECAGKH